MMLKVQEVTKRFGGLIAVNSVSINVRQGEIVGLIGPNGAGKTTLLNSIAGLDPPTSGSIFFVDEETTGLPPEVMCHKGLARTFQIPRPFPQMTVLENVLVSAMFGYKHSIDLDPIKNARDQLNFLEFPCPESTISETLNTVQLKQLDLARAIASHPKLLLLDELFSGLTEGEQKGIVELVRKINKRGVTIIIVEHIMRIIMDLCDRIIVLQFGNKIAEGSTDQVVNDPAVIDAYLGDKN